MKRKRMNYKKLVVVLVAAFALWHALDIFRNLRSYSRLREGDLVFQNSTSDQSPLIWLAQGSPYTHCGIIIEKPDGLYVLEAVSQSKLTPWKEWKRRGRLGYVATRRVVDEPVKINYRKYLGQPYDLAFRFDNGKLYCSELIYEVYRRELGITLCKPHKVSHYHLTWWPSIKKVMRRRGISRKQEAVAPVDILESGKCRRI